MDFFEGIERLKSAIDKNLDDLQTHCDEYLKNSELLDLKRSLNHFTTAKNMRYLGVSWENDLHQAKIKHWRKVRELTKLGYRSKHVKTWNNLKNYLKR